MDKILQFGEGNFLRAFVDIYFDTLNKKENTNYEIYIVKPRANGKLTSFHQQKNKFNVAIRGYKNSEIIDEIYPIDVIKSAIESYELDSELFKVINDVALKMIISNTTEAGICFNSNDKFNDYKNISFPAKLTSLLYERYKNNLPGLYILPCELIDNNATVLNDCVNKYIDLWNLEKAFKDYVNNKNYFVNTLVDRIVSGYPKDENIINEYEKKIGYKDNLLTICEPYGLWAIEKINGIENIIKAGTHNIDAVLTDDINYYKKRKVRILNGSHTNLVPISLWLNMFTVYDVMKNEKIKAFVMNTLINEIVPFVSENENENLKFVNDVIDRFNNPFLNHQLTSISLNSISKWRARILPSFIDYYQKNNTLPKNLTIGFAYLLNMYMNIKKVDNKFICELPSREIEISDNIEYLELFSNQSLHNILTNKNMWGIDLTKFENLEKSLLNLINEIKAGTILI